MAEQIKWDGSNICRVGIFVTEHGGELKSDFSTGLSVAIHGLELPLPIGHTLVATESGITVTEVVE